MKGAHLHRTRLALALLAVLPLGCGSEFTPGVGTIQTRSDAGAVWPGTNGGPGTLALRIELLSPMDQATLAAASAPELRARIVAVLPGTVEPAGVALAPEGTGYVIERLDDGTIVASGALVGPQANAEYTARLDLAGIETGSYRLRVQAAAQDGTSAEVGATVKIDNGPRITVLSPAIDGFYRGSLAVQVLIDYSPFTPGAMPLESFIDAREVALSAGMKPGLLEGIVEFEKLEPQLEGPHVYRVAAINDQGTRSEKRVAFTVDVTGPVITEAFPPAGTVVGGVVRVAARVSDPAGVLGDAVYAVIGNKKDVNFTLKLEPNAADPGLFTALFDTNLLTRCPLFDDDVPGNERLCLVFPNLSFRVTDRLGNEATLAYDFSVDNQPPLIDMDPGTIQILQPTPESVFPLCAEPFDPVGNYTRLGDMPGDLCGVGQVFDLRAEIEDQGNYATGLKGSPIAEIDPASVHAFVLADTAQPLVVDSNGDGICDAINPKLVPTTMPLRESGQVLQVRLAPLMPQGELDFDFPDAPMTCAQKDPKLVAAERRWPQPPPLCTPTATADTLVIGFPDILTGPDPRVFAIEPHEPWCTGAQFDTFANNVPDKKWFCVATAAADQVGNGHVSAPLRLWVDYAGQLPAGAACHQPAVNAGAAPGCTGVYDKKTDAIVPGKSCRALGFGKQRPPVISHSGQPPMSVGPPMTTTPMQM